MRVKINGHDAQLNYLFFEGEGAGHIAQLLIASTGEKSLALYRRLSKKLKGLGNFFAGVMASEKLAEPGFTEIRVLGGRHLEIIDAMRLLGFTVKEADPIPSE